MSAPEQKINVNTSRIAAAMVAEVESDLPLLMHANKSVQKPFETAGDGTVMDVIVPEMPTVGDGAWINEGDPLEAGGKGNELDYNNKAVPVTLKQKHVAFGLPSALEFNSIADMENLVTKPYGSTLASAVQSEVAEAAMNGSAFTAVLTGADKFPQVSEAIASIRKGRSYGKLYGVIGSTLNGKLSGEGIKYFNPQNNISDIWKSARLGEYNGADWFTTPDVQDLVIPTGAPAAAASVTIASTAIQTITKGKKLFVNDASEVWLQTSGYVSSGVSSGPVKGSVLTISGVNVADIFGNDLGEAFSFKVLDTKIEDVSGTDQLFIKVKNPGYGDACYTGGSANITSVTNVLGAGTYYRGVIYAQNALCVAFGRFAKPVGAEVGQYSGQNGVTIRTTTQYQVMKDRNVYRFDTLVGANLSRPNWAVEIIVAKS